MAERHPGEHHDHDGAVVLVYDTKRSAYVQPLPLPSDHRSSCFVPRYFHHDDTRAGDSRCASRIAEFAASVAILLAVWGIVQLSGQCPNVSDVYCHGLRVGREPPGRSQYIIRQQTRRTVADRNLVWIRLYGSEYVYRKWTKLHG